MLIVLQNMMSLKQQKNNRPEDMSSITYPVTNICFLHINTFVILCPLPLSWYIIYDVVNYNMHWLITYIFVLSKVIICMILFAIHSFLWPLLEKNAKLTAKYLHTHFWWLVYIYSYKCHLCNGKRHHITWSRMLRQTLLISHPTLRYQ
jgi:hypothetical protein